jgi:UDP-glucose 4-epimerase
VLRYFNVFGPRQNPRSQYSAVVARFITAALEGGTPTIFGDGEQSRDFTYVDNVVETNVLAISAAGAAGQTFNVACGRRVSLNEMVHALRRILGTEITPRHAERRPGDVEHSLADIDLARRVLDYVPRVPSKTVCGAASRTSPHDRPCLDHSEKCGARDAHRRPLGRRRPREWRRRPKRSRRLPGHPSRREASARSKPRPTGER